MTKAEYLAELIKRDPRYAGCYSATGPGPVAAHAHIQKPAQYICFRDVNGKIVYERIN
jgi:hypothetical protein